MKKFQIKEDLLVEVDIEKKVVKKNSEKPKSFNSKSEVFKNLYELGMEINEISNLTNSHYSFVYGVIQNKCQMRKSTKNTKSDEIRKLSDSGKNPGEIAKILNSNYSFVFSVVKKYKQQKNTK